MRAAVDDLAEEEAAYGVGVGDRAVLDLSALADRHLWASRPSRLQLAQGPSSELLELQSLLDCALPLSCARVDALRTLHTSICSRASANALDAVAPPGTPRIERQTRRALLSLEERGLGALSELPGSLYAIEELAISIDGQFMGSMVARQLIVVLFHMLQQATLANFDLVSYKGTADGGAAVGSGGAAGGGGSAGGGGAASGGGAAGGGEAGASRRVLSSYFSTSSCTAAQDALRLEYANVSGVLKLEPCLLALVSSSDATTKQTTSSIGNTWDPFSITFANFEGRWGSMDASRGLWGLMPVLPSNPFSPTGPTRRQYAAYAQCAALTHHTARDILVQQLVKLKDGFLWEIEPGRIVWLVPRLLTRAGDTPAMAMDLSLFRSASAGFPCRLSLLPSAQRNRVVFPPLRSVVSIINGASARPAPRGAPRAARAAAGAAMRTARSASITPLGRRPWCLTPAALSVSVRQKSPLLGPMDILHVLPGGTLKKTAAVVREECATLGTTAVLLKRFDNLLPFSSLGTHLRLPRASVLSKRVEANDYLDLAAVLPSLLTDLVGPAEWKALMHATFMQARLYAAVTQESYDTDALATLEQLGRATLRAVRVFRKFRKMIKPSMLKHYARLTRVFGALSKICTTFTEGYHRHVKALADAVAAGPARPLRMLQRHALQQAIGLLVHVDGARPPAADGGAAAAAPALPNLAGHPLVAPTSRPEVLSASEAGFASLGGVVGDAWLRGQRVELVHGPTRPSGQRVRGHVGLPMFPATAASTPPVWSRAVARAALVHLGFAADPPAGVEAVAAYMASIRDASRTLDWRGDSVDASHFTAAGALNAVGAARVCAAADAHVHDTVSFVSSGTGATEHPDLCLDKRRFVSVLAQVGHPFAPLGEQFVVGEVCAIVTLPS